MELIAKRGKIMVKNTLESRLEMMGKQVCNAAILTDLLATFAQ